MLLGHLEPTKVGQLEASHEKNCFVQVQYSFYPAYARINEQCNPDGIFESHERNKLSKKK